MSEHESVVDMADAGMMMVNQATGNAFEVIGHDRVNYVKAGMRLWLSIDKNPGGMAKEAMRCAIGFRIRYEFLGADDTKTSQGIEKTLKIAYPLIKWTGGSLRHGSIAGKVATQYPVYEAEKIISQIETQDAGGSLWDAFAKLCPTLGVYKDRGAFNEWFIEKVKALFPKSESSDGVSSVVLTISGFEKVLSPVIELSEPPKVAKILATEQKEPIQL
jgi:hypothetical protein